MLLSNTWRTVAKLLGIKTINVNNSWGLYRQYYVSSTHNTQNGWFGSYHYMENKHKKNSIRSNNWLFLFFFYIESLRSLCSTSPLKFEVKLWPKPKLTWPDDLWLPYDKITRHLMLREWGKKEENNVKVLLRRPLFFWSSKRSHNSLEVSSFIFFNSQLVKIFTASAEWRASRAEGDTRRDV